MVDGDTTAVVDAAARTPPGQAIMAGGRWPVRTVCSLTTVLAVVGGVCRAQQAPSVQQQSQGDNTTNIAINTGTVNIHQMDPLALAAAAKAFADQISASAEEKANAKAQAAELAKQLGVTN